jgi:hypothetical protein
VKRDLGTAPRSDWNEEKDVSNCMRLDSRRGAGYRIRAGLSLPVVRVQTFTRSLVYALGGSPSASEAIKSSDTRRDCPGL